MCRHSLPRSASEPDVPEALPLLDGVATGHRTDYSHDGSSLIPGRNPRHAGSLVLRNTLLSPISSSCNFFFLALSLEK